MSYVGRWVRTGLALAIVSALGWLGGCSDRGITDCCDPLVQGLIISDPVQATAVARGSLVASALTGRAGDDVAYVSLPPGTVPTGATATIRRVGDSSLTTAVFGGGFDPVPVVAQAGDSIDVIVRNAAGGTVLQVRLAVAAARPPIIVRTDPPRKKTDVPINAAIVIVFSEPVDGGTLTPSSVRLFHGTDAVAGTITLLQGTGALVGFVPTTPLAANTEYRLEVTPAVQDLDGDALQTGLTATFTTGQSSVGPPASIVMSPSESIHVTTHTYQLTATVRDAAGNQLLDPITWSTGCPQQLAVSQTGLVTALADGACYISASVNGLTAEVLTRFIPGAPGSVEIAPASATIAAIDSIVLWVTVRDNAGTVLRSPPSVTITNSAPGVATLGGGNLTTPPTPWSFPIGVVGVTPGSATITVTSGSASGSATVTVGPPVPVATVTITPSSATLVVQDQDTVRLTATIRDATGRSIGRSITWTSDNGAAAIVDTNGLVTAVSPGGATITATSEGVSGTADVTVIPPQPVASITVTPDSAELLVQDTVRLAVTLRDAAGRVLSGRSITWTSDNVAVASVDVNGLVTGVTPGLATVSATSEGVSGTAAISVIVIEFASVGAGSSFSCGLTTLGAAYCWGYIGQLRDGTTYWVGGTPVPVSGDLSFTALTTGTGHSCGLAASGTARCWGSNNFAQLGQGVASLDFSWSPGQEVIGGLSFTTVTAGGQHTCSLTASGSAYCWGSNFEGQLGIGRLTTNPEGSRVAFEPLPVTGGLTFTAVSAGNWHSCGLTTSGAAFCWGSNFYGQLGDGSTSSTLSPQAVSGGLTFSAVAAGYSHTCGLTTGGAVYCWGDNAYGQLGNGTTSGSSVPMAVAGGNTYSSVAAGIYFTCAIGSGGTADCWGYNFDGRLGVGIATGPEQCGSPAFPCSTTPVPVVGGLTFSQLTAGGHTCGRASSGVVYCWGGNMWGQLGDASTTNSAVPAKVAGQP